MFENTIESFIEFIKHNLEQEYTYSISGELDGIEFTMLFIPTNVYVTTNELEIYGDEHNFILDLRGCGFEYEEIEESFIVSKDNFNVIITKI